MASTENYFFLVSEDEVTPTRYGVIMADPPWSFRDSANAGKRGAVHKYKTMGLDEICSLDVASVAADDCLLALWWVAAMPIEAVQVAEAWGFDLRTMKGFTWHKRTVNGKSHIGMGNWTRANTEDCLFAVRGRPKRVDCGVRQFIDSPIGRHSEKPHVARLRLEQLMGDVPRLEMFARHDVPGWDAWGIEVESNVTIGAKENHAL